MVTMLDKLGERDTQKVGHCQEQMQTSAFRFKHTHKYRLEWPALAAVLCKSPGDLG